MKSTFIFNPNWNEWDFAFHTLMEILKNKGDFTIAFNRSGTRAWLLKDGERITPDMGHHEIFRWLVREARRSFGPSWNVSIIPEV